MFDHQEKVLTVLCQSLLRSEFVYNSLASEADVPEREPHVALEGEVHLPTHCAAAISSSPTSGADANSLSYSKSQSLL